MLKCIINIQMKPVQIKRTYGFLSGIKIKNKHHNKDLNLAHESFKKLFKNKKMNEISNETKQKNEKDLEISKTSKKMLPSN